MPAVSSQYSQRTMNALSLKTNDQVAEFEGCYFSQQHADRAINFIEKYYIPSQLARTIKLLPWQREFVSNLYGWRNSSGGKRYRRATLSTAKKQGKTILQSGIQLYEFLGTDTPSAFCVSASTTRENASQIYREIAYSIRNNANLNKICKCLDSTKEIRCAKKNSRYKSFSADSSAAEGENLSACSVDELHAHNDSGRLYRALEFSTISRPDSTVCIISTAGHDQGHIWYDLFQYAKNVQENKIIDTSLLARIYTLDADADIEDEKNWSKSNPSIGTSFSVESFRQDLQRAKNEGTSALLSFRRYRLNQWCQSEDAYIDPIFLDACPYIEEHELKAAPLFVGCDLSQTTDTCAVVCVWALPERRFAVRVHSWVCEDGVKKREQSNLPKYQTFAAENEMTITPGNANDYRAIKRYLYNLRANHNLKEIIFDQWNALEMVAELMSDNITVYRMPQNHKYYTSPCKEFSIAVQEKRILHDHKKLLRWQLGNTKLDYDAYENVKPSKDKSTEKIDITVATLMGYSRAVTQPINGTAKPSIYATRGIYTV